MKGCEERKVRQGKSEILSRSVSYDKSDRKISQTSYIVNHTRSHADAVHYLNAIASLGLTLTRQTLLIRLTKLLVKRQPCTSYQQMHPSFFSCNSVLTTSIVHPCMHVSEIKTQLLSSIVINHHHLSLMVITRHQSSSIIINHHKLSLFIIISHHQSS